LLEFIGVPRNVLARGVDGTTTDEDEEAGDALLAELLHRALLNERLVDPLSQIGKHSFLFAGGSCGNVESSALDMLLVVATLLSCGGSSCDDMLSVALPQRSLRFCSLRAVAAHVMICSVLHCLSAA
jgi:hypothetical protein